MGLSVGSDVEVLPTRRSRWRPRPLRPEFAVLLAGLLPGLVVYGLHWRRGYFLDDPFMDALSLRELVDSVWLIRARPLGTVLVAITYLLGEPAGRVLSAVALAATATLAAVLVRRTCGGRYAPVVVALLVVYPLLDWESALYWYAAIQYPAGAAFGLAGGHAFLSTLRATSLRSAVLSGVGCVALYVGGLACTEVAVNFLLLIPALATVEAVRHRRFDRQSIVRLGAVLVGAVVTLGAVGGIIYLPENDFTSARGEFLLNPLDAAQRIIHVWIPSLRSVAFSPRRAAIHLEAFSLGAENLATPSVLVVAIAAVVAGGFALRAVLRAPADPPRPELARAATGVVVAAIALFFTSSWFPAALLSGQGPVTRLLFTPWVAFALAAGAAVAALEAGGVTRAVRATVALALLAVVPLALTLDGYGELFRLRDTRNDEQLAAWLGALDDAEPLPAGTRIASLYGADPLLGRPSVVDDTLAGITETPWALSRMVHELSGRSVFAIGGHPFVPVCIERTSDPTQLRVTTMFNDETVSADAFLAAEIHGARLVLIDEISFGLTSMRFPLADRVVDPTYEHVRLQTDGDRLCRMYGQPVP